MDIAAVSEFGDHGGSNRCGSNERVIFSGLEENGQAGTQRRGREVMNSSEIAVTIQDGEEIRIVDPALHALRKLQEAMKGEAKKDENLHRY